MKRLPDVLDVWIDAGTLSWNILDYPKNKELYEKLWPCDFILEAKEQVRGWFNMLMVTSILAFDDNTPFLNCYMHGMLTDVEGQKMSKSLGNVISPYEIIDKYGADTLRQYMCSTNAGEDINFSWDEVQLRHRNLSVLWNTHMYLLEQSRLFDIRPVETKKIKLELVEKYMLSKTHSAIKKATEAFEKYSLHEVPGVVTELFLELSRTYIQMTRDKSNSEDEDDKTAVISTIFHALYNAMKIMSPLCPFITEQMYQNMKDQFELEEDSIHESAWPKYDEKLIDKDLEQKFEVAKGVTQSILSAREKAQLGVRWPVIETTVITKEEETKKAVEALADLIKTQTNVKKLTVLDGFNKVKLSVKADYTKIGPDFGEKSPSIIASMATTSPESIITKIEKEGKFEILIGKEKIELTDKHIIVKREVPDTFAEGEFRTGYVYLDKTRNAELESEGFARELMRRVQSLRKDSKLSKPDRISLFIKTDDETVQMLKPWNNAIKDKVGAKTMNITHNEPAKMHEHKKKEKIKEKEFMIEFDKL